MAGSERKSSQRQAEKQPARPWTKSVLWAVIAVGVLLTVSVVANVAIGRVIHWNIVSVLGVLGIVFLSIGRRYRTI